MFESLYLNILSTFAILGLIYLYFTRNFDYWKKKGVPFMTPEPFFGNVRRNLLFQEHNSDMLKRLYDNFSESKFVGAFRFQEPFLVIRDPELIKQLTVKDFSSFHDRGIPADEKRRPLSGNLFVMEGIRWRALRSKLTPTFTSGKMKMMYQLMMECSEELRNFLTKPASQGEVVEMREILAKFTTDVIGSCAFGLQFNSINDPNSEFRRMGRKVFEFSFATMLRRVVFIYLPPVAKLLGFSASGSDISKFFLNAVKETVDYREKNNIKRNDFMQLLIQLKNKGKVDEDNDSNDDNNAEETTNNDEPFKMTDNLLAAQAFVFFVAGFETSSTAMSFALYELALNPDIQERLREEVTSVLMRHDNQFTYDALFEMKYLDKVVSETLRKYPPGGSLLRNCTKPYVIPDTNILIEKDTKVFVPVYALHHDPKYYPDPDRFDPERFSEENKSKRQHYTYLPFGEGPRNCIGMRFGLMQTKAGLATVLRDFRFSPSDRTRIPIRKEPASLVITSKDGIWLKITPVHH